LAGACACVKKFLEGIAGIFPGETFTLAVFVGSLLRSAVTASGCLFACCQGELHEVTALDLLGGIHEPEGNESAAFS